MEYIKIEAEDIGEELYHLNETIDVDGERMAYLEERRDKLIKIKKKYGPELADVLTKYENAVEEAQKLIDNSDELEKLTAERGKLLVEVSDKAKSLSLKRENAAVKLSEKIEGELKFLDMPNVKLTIANTTGKLTNLGMDNMELLISVNAGEPPKPIAKIASGGELSRIMLAIKNVIAEKDDIPTLIFDEIDTGVSGRAAQKIGIKLREISRLRQVLCVTHLSQIAVMADTHLLIEKITKEQRTFTNVSQLDDNRRISEIARILCGDNITDIALQNAKEQIESKVKIYNEFLNKKSKTV